MRTMALVAFERMVTDLRNGPGNLPLPLYVTLICPVFPGMMGFLVYSGTVHPHDEKAC